MRKSSKGFTIIEMVVAVTVFGILLVGVLSLIGMLNKNVKAVREQTVLASLATNYMEIVRNLPYSQVGTITGNPSGNLADLTAPIVTSIESVPYQIYYEVTYVDDPADGTILAGTDVAPNDYKQVKMFIKNTTSNHVTTFSSNVTPKGLEGTVNSGAIFIRVIDANGQPVNLASVHIQNIAGTIVLDRTTDASGNWIEVGLPAGVNTYHIVVTKAGYSTDQTYPITVQNPNPVKPDVTVVNGQVTLVSFAIDLLSNLTIRTLNSLCQPINGVGVNVTGSKLIGISPNVLKFNNNYTSAAGQILLNNIEWDTYIPTLLTGQNLIILGTSPIQQIFVLPGSSATYTMILGTETTANSLLVIVKDAATGTALENANVHLHKGGSEPQDYYGITGGSIWVQNSWTGGPGQANFIVNNQYFADDGNIDVNSNPTGIRLKKVSGRYVLTGQLTSSTFDTGAPANFTTLTWEPTSQDPATTLKFQIATNNDNATWNYVGPDGTAATYYTISGSNIASVHDNDRYIRYRVYESTTNDKKTPVLTSLGLNYVSGCFTPGQVSFNDLTAGNNYDLTVTLAGYQDVVINNMTITDHQSIEVLMSP